MRIAIWLLGWDEDNGDDDNEDDIEDKKRRGTLSINGGCQYIVYVDSVTICIITR